MANSDLARSVVVAGVGFLAVAAVAALAIGVRRTPIEDDLTHRSEGALAAAGFTDVAVSFEGRDATLTGTLESDADRRAVRMLVGDLEGVRVVRGSLHVAGVPPTTTTTTTASATATVPMASATTALAIVEASFGLAPFDGGVQLTGVMPSEDAAAAIRAAAVAAFGAASVDDRLVVDISASDPGWVADLPEAITGLRSVAEPSLDILPPDAVLGGLIASEAGRGPVVDAIAALGLTVEDHLAVAEPPDSGEAETLEAALDAAVEDASVLFASGSTDISSEGEALLDALARLIVAVPGARIEIAGHTDDVGSPAANLALSADRARAVAAYLVSAGVDPVQVYATGYGESRPIADNATEAGRAANRRIEFNVEGAG